MKQQVLDSMDIERERDMHTEIEKRKKENLDLYGFKESTLL